MKREVLSIAAALLLTGAVFAQDDMSAEKEAYVEDLGVSTAETMDQHKMSLKPDLGFEFKGYARAGVLFSFVDGFNSSEYDGSGGFKGAGGGWNGSGAKQRVGRLGNEPDNYWEMEWIKKFSFGGQKWGAFHFMLAQGDQSDNGTWLVGNIAFRESFFEGGGFSKHPDITYWAGKRYYHHNDIHIMDLFYREYSGTGVGAQNIGGFLELAYVAGDGSIVETTISDSIYGGAGNTTTAERKTIIHNIQAQVAFADGKLKVIAMGQLQPNAKQISQATGTNSDDAAVTGLQLDAELALEPVTLVLQYGFGVGANIGQVNYGGQNQGDQTLRFLAHSTLEPEGSRFSLQSAGWAEMNINDDADENDGFDRNNMIKTAIVARPALRMNDNFVLVGEAGLGFDSELGSRMYDTQYKFTIAPTLQFEMGAWARPQIRTFVTYNGWDGEGAREYSVFGDDVKGDFVGGVQMEIWF